MDEMYSYGLMNYSQVSIADADDLMGRWHSPEYFQDYISISHEEAGDWSPVYNNQTADVHPPLFYLLLRVFASLTIDGFSKWTGIVLNIMIWIGSAILVFLISRRLTRDDRLALVITLFVGLTAAMLNATLYIRMYELAAFNILLISHIALWLIDLKKLRWRHIIPIIIAISVGIMTHYHYLFYLAILSLLIIYNFYKTHRRADIVKFIVAGVIAMAICLSIFPAMVSQLLHGHPNSPDYFSTLQHIGQYLLILDHNVFNYMGIIIAIAALIIIFVFRRKITFDRQLLLLAIPVITYFLIVAVTSPWIELRYIMPICPIIAMTTLIILVDLIKSYRPKQYRVIACALIGILMIATPIIHPRLEMVYQQYNHIADRVVDLGSPILYVFNTSHNRFLDDVYLLTLTDSYVIDSQDINQSDLEQVFVAKNVTGGLIVIINSGNENDLVLNQIETAAGLSHNEYLQRLNAADIYYLN